MESATVDLLPVSATCLARQSGFDTGIEPAAVRGSRYRYHLLLTNSIRMKRAELSSTELAEIAINDQMR